MLGSRRTGGDPGFGLLSCPAYKSKRRPGPRWFVLQVIGSWVLFVCLLRARDATAVLDKRGEPRCGQEPSCVLSLLQVRPMLCAPAAAPCWEAAVSVCCPWGRDLFFWNAASQIQQCGPTRGAAQRTQSSPGTFCFSVIFIVPPNVILPSLLCLGNREKPYT